MRKFSICVSKISHVPKYQFRSLILLNESEVSQQTVVIAIVRRFTADAGELAVVLVGKIVLSASLLLRRRR